MPSKKRESASKPSRGADRGKPSLQQPETNGANISRDEAHALALDELRTLAERSGNPVYIWRAIDLCCSWAALDATLAASNAQDGAIAAMNAVPLPLPDWVLRYLGFVAHNLVNLAHGRDPKALQAIPTEGWSAREAAAARAWIAGTLEPKQALLLVPRVMGLADRGWNAFERFGTASRQQAVAMWMDLLRAVHGMTLDEAAEHIAEREGYSEAGSVLRVVRKAKKARAVSKPRG